MGTKAPYDALHVLVAADRVPEALHEQLKPGGDMTQYLEQHDTRRRMAGLR